MTVDEMQDAVLAGRGGTAHFRKVPSQAVSTGQWFDLSMAGGSPVAFYYASEPLVAAVPSKSKYFLPTGDALPGGSKLLYALTLLTQSASLIGPYILLDYLLYYPFVDADDTGVQTMDNTVSLPRNTDGDGVMIMCVALTTTTGTGWFRLTYVNQDGDVQTTPLNPCVASASVASTLLQRHQSQGGNVPYVALAPGDTGVRSIIDAQFTTPNGGLVAFVLVKPLKSVHLTETNVALEEEYPECGFTPEINGACLNFIVCCSGSPAGAAVIGYVKHAFTTG